MCLPTFIATSNNTSLCILVQTCAVLDITRPSAADAVGPAVLMTAPAGLTPLAPPPSLLSPAPSATLSPPLSEPDQQRPTEAGGRLSFFGRSTYRHQRPAPARECVEIYQNGCIVGVNYYVRRANSPSSSIVGFI